MLKAIIFDMDGVIIDSEPSHAKSALEVLKRFGANVDITYPQSFIGSSTKKMAEDAVKTFGLPVSAEELLQEFDDAKKAHLKEEGYIVLPGIIDLIKNLHQKGVKLAIASSSNPSEIEKAVKALGIKKYFTKLVSSTNVKNPKPAPDCFNLVLKELGVNAKECMVVEDSHNGIKAAKAAGIACVGFVNPNSNGQDLSEADVLLESFTAIDYRFFKNVHSRSSGTPITVADTKRLVIRELTTKDIPHMYEMYQNPEVREFIPDIDEYLEVEIEKQAAYIRNVYSFYGYGIWGVFSKTSKQMIGRCGFENLMIDGKEEIALSYLLDKEHWGYGYALECCKAVFDFAKSELDISRIAAVIDKDNARSIHTAQNLGMQYEKDVTYKNRDCVLYAIAL